LGSAPSHSTPAPPLQSSSIWRDDDDDDVSEVKYLSLSFINKRENKALNVLFVRAGIVKSSTSNMYTPARNFGLSANEISPLLQHKQTRLGWTSGCSGLVVEYRTRNRSAASNLEQVANLLCAQANASYPQQLRLRSEGLVWLIGAMVCLLAAPWVQLSVSACNGWPHNALRHHWLMPISCH